MQRIFDADNFDRISTLPERFRHQIDDLLAPFQNEFPQLQEAVRSISSEFNSGIAGGFFDTPSVVQIRKSMGTDQLHQKRMWSENPIAEIWEMIGKKFPGVTIDQFFGFSPSAVRQGPLSVVSGIIGCHVVLNLIGYHADQRLGTDTRLKGAASDGRHIAYAAFCDAVISEDRRFCAKANAIYEYAGIRTTVAHLESR